MKEEILAIIAESNAEISAAEDAIRNASEIIALAKAKKQVSERLLAKQEALEAEAAPATQEILASSFLG